ncbi:MAG: SDR family oxidoreductase [Cyanobacteria bacterium CAN_BIN43]|nr:SDR family oxidoreductase [Cyanobacteria bacterium CAN_BIN43]
MFNFQGKAVLVTGASRGIGKATAIAFAQEGACVAVHYSQDQDAAAAVQESLSGTGHCVVQADIADAVAVERMVGEAIAHLGKIDILVNNAGIYKEHPLDKTDYQNWQQAWQQTLNVNLLGAVNASYCVSQSMMERKEGRIINVTSRGAFRGEPNSPAYGASKAGLNAFSQSLAQHLAPYNISVTAVAPGWVATDMARPILESPAGDAIRQQSPLHRVARPEEIAHTILFLAAAESEFLTGGIVDVNGASYLRS